MQEKTPKEGFAFKIQLPTPGTPVTPQQMSKGEEIGTNMVNLLGMLPNQYYTRRIEEEEGNIVLQECFQYAVLPDDIRDISVEYRRDIGDIHLRKTQNELPYEEVPEVSWMKIDEQSAVLQLDEEKENYEVGQHPDEVMIAAALF